MEFNGTRVIPGPYWSSGESDQGEGRLGTVVNVNSSAGKVKVIWDFGGSGLYKAGDDGLHELLIYDNGPTGVEHDGVTCDSCLVTPITGIRWKCRNCKDFDLCTLCYMGEKHASDHKFLRYNTESSTVSSIDPRKGCKTINIHGILPGASVTRGVDWNSGNEDGGNGNEGRVIELKKWGSNSHNGGVSVQWRNGFKSDYRVGGEGCVDLICLSESKIYKCFPDCLPVLDVINPHTEVKVGDKVKMVADIGAVEQVLSEIDNWNPAIEKYKDKEGTIIKINDRLISVQYDNTQKWHLFKTFLIKTHSFSEGEYVRIIDEDTKKMETLMEDHGGWVSEMKQTKGKVGRIIKVCDDGDLKVQVMNDNWFFSPVCCVPINASDISKNELLSIGSLSPSTSLSTNSSDSSSELSDIEDIQEQADDALVQMLMMPIASHGLVVAAAQGDLSAVKSILKIDAKMVDTFKQGKTALQMACHKGHEDVVEFLLANNADINLQDDEGDAPIHFAAGGDQYAIVKLLWNKGADIDKLNKKLRSAFHLAICHDNYTIAEFLLRKDCDINTQDSDGDSPLHDALEDPNEDILNMLIFSQRYELNLYNNDGITPVHKAVQKHLNKRIFEKLIAKCDDMDSFKTSIGQHTPLHVAAINANTELAVLLIKLGKCKVNTADKDGRTALHLAVIVRSEPMIDLLLFADADINHQDNDGNTPAHCSLLPIQLHRSTRSYRDKFSASDTVLSITHLLTEQGADLGIKNKRGQTVYDLIDNDDTKVVMRRIYNKRKKRPVTAKDSGPPAHWTTMTEQERVKIVELKAGMEGADEEYHNVIKLFRKSIGNRKPVRIERIQNIDQWEAYAVKKKSMGRSYGFNGVNERDLFHGTKPDIVHNIVHQSLDIRENELGLYGDGIYFATEAKMSDGYTTEDHDRHRYMFVCKVLVGKYTEGKKGMRKPPAIDDNPNVRYDSAVNDEEKPTIFVIFDNAQCYPAYLITYK